MAIANMAGCCCTCPQQLCVTGTCVNAVGATITVKDAGLATVATCVLGRLTEGMAADLDGSAYLYCPDGAGGMQATNQFYLAFWVNPTSVTGLQTIASKDSEWWVFADDTDLVFQVQTSGGLFYARAAGALAAGTWTHVMVAYTATTRTMRVYIDGVLAASQALASGYEVTKTWDFAANSEGWSFVFTSDPLDGWDGFTFGIWESADGDPANGCLNVYTQAPSPTPRVGYWEWSGLWTGLGLPAASTITSVRMEGINTKSFGNMEDGAGFSIGPFELWHPDGFLYATFWSGRSVTVEDGGWVATGAQSDQSIPFALSGTGASIKLRMGTTVHGHNLAMGGGFEFDHLSIVATIAGAIAPTTGLGDVFLGYADGTLDGDTAGAFAGGLDEMFYGNAPSTAYHAILADRLYNGGDGRCAAPSTAFVSDGIDTTTAVLWGLRACWPFDEASGTREPSIGLDTFNFLEGGGTTGNRTGAVATCYGAPTCCMEIDPSVPETFTVEGSLPGHISSTATVTFTDCKNAIATSIAFCPPTYEYAVNVTGCRGFGVPGVDVVISGDQSDSGTTDGDGVASFTFTSQADCEPDALTVALTPPVGRGLVVRDPSDSCPSPGSNPATVPTLSPEGNPCSDANGYFDCLIPDIGYLCWCASPYPIPTTLNYSDDHGNVTPLTFLGTMPVFSIANNRVENCPVWEGQYSYAAASAAQCLLCWDDGVGTTHHAYVKDQGGTITAVIRVQIIADCEVEVIRDVGIIQACDACATYPATTCSPKSWRLYEAEDPDCPNIILNPRSSNRWTGSTPLITGDLPTISATVTLSRISGQSVSDDTPGDAIITG